MKPTIFHGWLRFQPPPDAPFLSEYFTVGHRVTVPPSQPVPPRSWTGRFNRFKKADKAARGDARRLLAHIFPPLLDRLELDRTTTIITPALSSMQTSASETAPLSELAKACAEAAEVCCSCDVLTKKRHSSLSERGANRAQRRTILKQAGYSARRLPDVTSVFVLDDLVTTASTLSAVATAIGTCNPCVKIYGLALGATSRREYLQDILPEGSSKPNEHIPPEWDKVWVGSGEVTG